MQMNTPQTTRCLTWDGCHNVRDLGGLETSDGYRTRWQSVIRADLLNRLTPVGQQSLLDYGVQTIIDLRAPREVQAEPSLYAVQQMHLCPLTYLNLPIEYYYPHVSTLISLAQTRAEIYCIILDHYPEAVATIMRAIATASSGGVVIHCLSGKDRTGIIAALLLCLAKVPADIIAEDYAESQLHLQPLREQQLAKIGDKAATDFWIQATATADMMKSTLAHLEAQYGGARDYLKAAKMTNAEIDLLKHKLR